MASRSSAFCWMGVGLAVMVIMRFGEIAVVTVLMWKSGAFGIGLPGHWQDVRRDAGPAGEGNNRGAAVATEFVGGRDDTVQRRGDGQAVQFRQHRIGGGTMAVTRDKHRNLFSRNSTFGWLAASLAGRARHGGSLALERFQNKGLFVFDDPRQDLGFVAGQRFKKPVSPSKCRRVMNAAPFCGLRCADAVDHGLGLCGPFVLQPQMSQRRSRQGVERAAADFAAIAWGKALA